MYTIKDIDGKKLKVTDLENAIEQARLFKGFRHAKTEFRQLDKRLKKYWTDVYKKLLFLKENSEIDDS